MASIEEMRDQFTKKLSDAKEQRDERLEKDVADLVHAFSRSARSVPITQVHDALNDIDDSIKNTRSSSGRIASPRQAMVNITHSVSLKSLDDFFIREFQLDQYFPTSHLTYPTILCETLEEFFKPFTSDLNYSDLSRKQYLAQLISEAQETAQKNRGGIFGVNFPGKACYLNGWLFATLAGIPVDALTDHPEVMQGLLATAAHEKLGHGFISAYSTWGKLKSEFGITLTEIASKFGLKAADDAEAQLRQQQNNLLFSVSQLLEEGWANWIEKYVQGMLNNATARENYGIPDILKAIAQIPDEVEDSQSIKKLANQAVGMIFGKEVMDMHALLEAVKFLHGFGDAFDRYLRQVLHQPLKYALGELICLQCESHLGFDCVPYAVLIAANVTFDPEKISFSDLKTLLESDPRLHPDARLAAISRIKLENPGDIKELTQKVNAQLSLSIPPELK